MLISCFVESSLPYSRGWKRLARCLKMNSNKTSSDDILQFVRRHGYMIVPQSNPPNEIDKARTKRKRSAYSGKCPFKMELKDYIDRVPRFLSSATCVGCDVRCKPVTYTTRLLRRKCGNYWLWEEQDVQVAFVLEQ